MLGKRLAHYEILEELGRGGMGQVYVARDTRLDREVALKVLPTDLAQDEDRLARFEREAKTLASINHPNIVTIFSVEEADGIRFMTMELVRGTTLDARVPETGMELLDFLEIAEPLAAAVAAAHDQGIHHRDLKPANVMVTEDGRVKVLDFGLAKLRKAPISGDEATQILTGEFTGDVTAEGKIVGTISYMSPEQAQGGTIDHRSDIFSLGIIFYEMVAGKRPFEGPNNISVLSSILKDEPRSISDVREQHDVPVPMARIIHRTLAKKPEQRYQSAGDLARDLADLRADLASGERMASGLHSGVHEPARGTGPGRSGLIIGAAIVLAAIAMAAIFFGTRDGDDTSVAMVASRAEIPSLAVLPFDNLAGDDDLDWLRQGLPEMLVTDLSQAVNLRVVGNDRIHTIMQRLNTGDGTMAAADVHAIGREAGVAQIIVGSFVRAGEQIRIDARVEDAATSDVLASERVSGSADAIFDLVDELSGRIRDRVGMKQMSDELMTDMSAAGMGDRDLADVTTSSVEAYRLYAGAQTRLHDDRPLEAIPLLERALELDPDFGMAWAKLSVAMGNSSQPDEAREAARRAFELSEAMPLEDRLYVRGRYYSLDPATIDDAIEAYARAAELFPNNTAVRNNLGIAYMNMGRFDDATVMLLEAIDLGTEFVGAYTNLARAYARGGRLDEAIDVLQRYLEVDPASPGPRAALAGYLMEAGRLDEATTEARTAVSLDGSAGTRATLLQLLFLQGDWEGVQDQIAAIETDVDTPTARWLAVQTRAGRAAFQGRIDESLEILLAEAEKLPVGSAARAQALSTAIGTAQELDDADLLDDLADRLETTGAPPGMDQTIPISRMLADAARGDVEAARAHALEFFRLVQGVELPEPQRVRLNGLMDGVIAKGSGDAETAVEALRIAYEAVPEFQDPGMSLSIAYYLGTANLELGRRAAAEEWFRRVEFVEAARSFAPIFALRAQWHLGKIAADRGEVEAALGHYRRFLEFWGDGDIDRDRVAEARAYVQANG